MLKTKRFRKATASLLLCLMLFVSANLPVSAGVSAPQIISSVNRNLTEPLSIPDSFFNLNGDKLVWADGRNGNLDIYYYNTTTGETQQITSDGMDQVQPVVSDNKIVWKDWRNGSPSIYQYDLLTGTESKVVDIVLPQGSGPTAVRGPELYGDLIAWEDYRTGNSDIFTYNFSTSELRQITTSTRSEFGQKLHENKIVYVRYVSYDAVTGYNYDLFLYDYSNGNTTQLTDNPYRQTSPRIFGNTVLFMDNRTDPNLSAINYDIWSYDLTTGEERMLVSGPGKQTSPATDGSKIMYIDDSSGYDNTCLYDIASGSIEIIDSTANTKNEAQMSGNKLFWLRNDGTSWNIYTATYSNGLGGLALQTTISGQSAAYLNSGIFNPVQVTLDGTDGLKANYTASPWTVTDARGTGVGWYTTMNATIPTSSQGKTISLTNLKLTVTNVTKAANALTSSDPAMLQSTSGVSLETAKTMISSQVNQGMGSFVFTPTLELSIPASSYAGEYNSTISATFYETAPSI